jgi:hypothetical protein
MAVFLTGFVSAVETAHPPGDSSLSHAAAMSGYSMDGYAVTPDTVLAEVSLFDAEVLAAGSIGINYEIAKVYATEQLVNNYELVGVSPDYYLRQ